MENDLQCSLERRLGRLHARQRLGIETDHEAQLFGQGLNFFHIENWYSIHSVIRTTLKLTGLYGRGKKNAESVVVTMPSGERIEVEAASSVPEFMKHPRN